MSPSLNSPGALARARKLRHSMTDGEKRLWRDLREFKKLYGIHVRRQTPVGPYVADFAIHSARLIIEVDGEHHFTGPGIARDRKRDAWLAEAGYRVVRFNTGELAESFDACIEKILHELGLMI
ncbi:endonuclease domain-containing protein [Hoeflea ulvae]|uniref:Endonuclease domain-containing protein n=1 Tax=Hoeflea ulvae TaxID=2983764 RepID=A0ABT3YKD4_9HYPH|nr:endonuclease domain-containing protein [Hoeflea ulvae]MCY0096282.1 endonuclease domain-containing protein [Hoeflea ulvae]